MTAVDKTRLDQRLLALGLAENRSRAQALIMAGKVLVDDTPLTKPGHAVSPAQHIRVKNKPHPFVSRGGVKLAHALSHFALSPKGITALDIGSSTGGFTDVLLRGGAAQVIAVDVGRGQLDWRLRCHKRVVVMEGVNARHLTAAMLTAAHAKATARDGAVADTDGVADIDGAAASTDEAIATIKPDWVVCDASFISLKKILPAPLGLVRAGGWLVALIKPQFEVGKGAVGKGGVVRDPALHAEVQRDIADWLTNTAGWCVAGITASPIQGADGNAEFFIAAQKPNV